jgi:superfamily I DNA and/or RNA helicase
MSRVAKNIILIGDQMQLEQPIQASHPKGSGQSTLEYFLGDKQTIPENLGIFLDTTWRMHPDVCHFVSQSFYEGRLMARPENINQRLILSEQAHQFLKTDAGISFIPVEHLGNTQSSREEGEAIKALSQMLIGQKYSDKKGNIHSLKTSDILVVTPYNAQVRLLESMLGDQISVGTVDKFQGQEAIVVIVSLSLSKGESGPRGIDFILDLHRINVAVSRAKSMAIVVGDPGIGDSDMSSIPMMRCLNLMCRLRKFSRQ